MSQEYQRDMKRTSNLEFVNFIFGHLRQSIPALLTIAKYGIDAYRHPDKTFTLTQFSKELADIYPTNIHIEGIQNLPKKGGFVIVASHIVSKFQYPCWFDTSTNPQSQIEATIESLRRIQRENDLRLILKDDDKSPLAKYKTALNHAFMCYPVSTDKPTSIRHAIQGLQNGEIVYIAPEGKNTLSLQQFNNGVSLLTLAQVPFVPAAYFEVSNGKKSYFILRYGKPITIQDLSSGKTKLKSELEKKQFANLLGYRVAQLLPHEYRGVYENAETVLQ